MFPHANNKPSAGSCRTCNTAVSGLSENRWSACAFPALPLRLIDKNGIDSVLADLRARGQEGEFIMATKGGRRKIKLESTAGTGHFHTANKEDHAREDVDQEI